MRIIQISDSHISHDAPQRLQDLTECVEAVNNEGADIVIHTGDITHNGMAEEYQAARKILDKLDAPYYVLAGNKDVRKELREAFSDHKYLHKNDDFIQYSIDQFSSQLIVLDTVQEHNSKGEFCDTRIRHLQSMLEQDTSKHAIIFMHHSPYEVIEIPDPQQFEDWSQVTALSNVLSEFDNIDAIYCGHVHRLVSGSTGNIPVHVLSCIAKDLRKGKLSAYQQTRPMYTVIQLVH